MTIFTIVSNSKSRDKQLNFDPIKFHISEKIHILLVTYGSCITVHHTDTGQLLSVFLEIGWKIILNKMFIYMTVLGKSVCPELQSNLL